jgi:hypothetical protein
MHIKRSLRHGGGDDAADIRKEPRYTGLSINLALSVRGIEALKAVGLESTVRALGSAIHGRRMHTAPEPTPCADP